MLNRVLTDTAANVYNLHRRVINGDKTKEEVQVASTENEGKQSLGFA